jgi:hypothetical protein
MQLEHFYPHFHGDTIWPKYSHRFSNLTTTKASPGDQTHARKVTGLKVIDSNPSTTEAVVFIVMCRLDNLWFPFKILFSSAHCFLV